jgi:hypothetical protein
MSETYNTDELEEKLKGAWRFRLAPDVISTIIARLRAGDKLLGIAKRARFIISVYCKEHIDEYDKAIYCKEHIDEYDKAIAKYEGKEGK